jgi:GDPmannose 4,6-dehydratase
VATGETRSLEEFVAAAFGAVGLDWREHVDADPALFRPADIEANHANPEKAARVLGWRASVRMEDAVRRMLEAERARSAPARP